MKFNTKKLWISLLILIMVLIGYIDTVILYEINKLAFHWWYIFVWMAFMLFFAWPIVYYWNNYFSKLFSHQPKYTFTIITDDGYVNKVIREAIDKAMKENDFGIKDNE